MRKYRRKKIAENLALLIEDNDDYTVAQILCTIMRSKNNASENMYDMTDENFSAALQDTITELNETENDC
jgi:hypothetical protein